jgi:putative transposase
MDSPKQLKTEEIKAQIKKLVKQTLQEALEAELEEFLGYPKYRHTESTNSRNGYNQKEVRTDSGEVEIRVPRDRDSKFEPKVVKKRQSVLEDLQDKIIALYAKGMTTRDIQEIVEDI